MNKDDMLCENEEYKAKKHKDNHPKPKEDKKLKEEKK